MLAYCSGPVNNPDNASKKSGPAAANSIPANMIKITGGAFEMGSNGSEELDEKPRHNVTVGSFYLAKYELTLQEFKAFIDDTGYKTGADMDGWSWILIGADRIMKPGVNWRCNAQGNIRPPSEYQYPVVHVTWYDATTYGAWLSKKTGKNYRLPTEAEWEYAAGGGNPALGLRSVWSGTSDIENLYTFANYNSDKDTFNYAAPCGMFLPNRLGLFDMSGNVWEWCSDWYADNYYKNSPSIDPQGPETGTTRLMRGGFWGSAEYYCRTAYRAKIEPGSHFYDIGFRIALQ